MIRKFFFSILLLGAPLPLKSESSLGICDFVKPAFLFCAGALAENLLLQTHCKKAEKSFDIPQINIAQKHRWAIGIPLAASTAILIFKSKFFWQKAFSIFSGVASFAQRQTT
jgi:hypothetical protein